MVTEQLVTFLDVPEIYELDQDIMIDYILKLQVKGSCKDWVGIYEKDWTSLDHPMAFEWGLGRAVNNNRRRRMVFTRSSFKTAKLNTKYQFVYINKYLEVLGKSTFFVFESNNCGSSAVDILNSGLINSSNSAKTGTSHIDYKISTDCKSTAHHLNDLGNGLHRCQFNSYSNRDEIYTSCPECKNIGTLIEIYKEATNKMKDSSEKLNNLHYRLGNVEYTLNLLHSSSNLPYLKKREHFSNYSTFVRDIIEEIDEESSEAPKSNKVPIKEDSRNLTEFTQKELLLKAIVGKQEVKIRELLGIMYQANEKSEADDLPSLTENTVVLLRTQEKMLPELCFLKTTKFEMEEE